MRVKFLSCQELPTKIHQRWLLAAAYLLSAAAPHSFTPLSFQSHPSKSRRDQQKSDAELSLTICFQSPSKLKSLSKLPESRANISKQPGRTQMTFWSWPSCPCAVPRTPPARKVNSPRWVLYFKLEGQLLYLGHCYSRTHLKSHLLCFDCLLLLPLMQVYYIHC